MMYHLHYYTWLLDLCSNQFAFFIFICTITQKRSIWHPFLVFRHNCNSTEWETSSMCPSREWSPLYDQWHRVSSWLARPKQWNYSFWQPGLFHADSLPVYHYTRLDWCPLLGKLFHRHIYGIEIFMAYTKAVYICQSHVPYLSYVKR